MVLTCPIVGFYTHNRDVTVQKLLRLLRKDLPGEVLGAMERGKPYQREEVLPCFEQRAMVEEALKELSDKTLVVYNEDEKTYTRKA